MSRIPEISDGSIKKMLKSVKPVIIEGDKLFYIKPVDPRRTAFMWDPKKTKEAKGLVATGTITTYHTWAYYGCFKPTIAEVLAQIPKEWVPGTVAFSVLGPETAADLNKHQTELNEGYHVAETTLYRKGSNHEVKELAEFKRLNKKYGKKSR